MAIIVDYRSTEGSLRFSGNYGKGSEDESPEASEDEEDGSGQDEGDEEDSGGEDEGDEEDSGSEDDGDEGSEGEDGGEEEEEEEDVEDEEVTSPHTQPPPLYSGMHTAPPAPATSPAIVTSRQAQSGQASDAVVLPASKTPGKPQPNEHSQSVAEDKVKRTNQGNVKEDPIVISSDSEDDEETPKNNKKRAHRDRDKEPSEPPNKRVKTGAGRSLLAGAGAGASAGPSGSRA